MSRLSLPCFLFALALLALTPDPAWAQADAAKSALAALPPEDQEIAGKLKFSQLELSPPETRRAVYIKGSIKVTNNSAKNVIAGKLELEGLMLCRNKDKEWKVVRATAPLEVAKRGSDVQNISFKQGNGAFDQLAADRKATIYDSYARIRYNGVVIAEIHDKPSFSQLKDWWMDESLIVNK